MTKDIYQVLMGSFDFQTNQAYTAFKRFCDEREEGASLALLSFHIGYVARLYEGLSYDIARIEGKHPVEKGCHFIDKMRSEKGLLSSKLQTVIGFYGMNLLKNLMDERENIPINRPFMTRAGNLETLVPNSDYTATNLDVPVISILPERTYTQIRHDTENAVRAKRFDLMKQALDDVRETYPQAITL